MICVLCPVFLSCPLVVSGRVKAREPATVARSSASTGYYFLACFTRATGQGTERAGTRVKEVFGSLGYRKEPTSPMYEGPMGRSWAGDGLRRPAYYGYGPNPNGPRPSTRFRYTVCIDRSLGCSSLTGSMKNENKVDKCIISYSSLRTDFIIAFYFFFYAMMTAFQHETIKLLRKAGFPLR